MKRPSSSVAPARREGGAHFGRYLLIGFFTIAPLWVTWLVVDFVFGLLARTGSPVLRGVALGLRPFSEVAADWLLNPILQYILAALLTVAGLYVVGLLTAIVLGRRLIAFMERQLERLPLVQTIYSATKRFLSTLQKPPVSTQRVVLIAFPSPETPPWDNAVFNGRKDEWERAIRERNQNQNEYRRLQEAQGTNSVSARP